MNIGIVIPTYKLCKHRLENLAFILRHLTSAKIPNIYVVEQHSEDESVRRTLESFPRVRYINKSIEGPTFNKSKLINHSVNELQFKYIWIYDVDVFLDTEFVIRSMPENVDVVRPYEKIIMLNEAESEKLKRTDLIYLDKRTYDGYNSFGKFSLILNRDIFEKVGGYDETFQGWGFQDLDLTQRIPKGCYKGYMTNTGFHMWHPRPSTEFYETNKNSFTKRHSRITKTPRKKKKNNLLDSF